MGLLDRARRNSESVASERQAMAGDAPATFLTGTGRDFGGLKDHDTAVKFRVPEPVRKAFEELVDYYESDFSTLVRHVLFIHLYGQYDLLFLAERGDRRFMPQGERETFSDMVLYSRAPDADNRTAQLGKNDNDLKVWMPGQLVDELDGLADRAGITRSQYIREVLVSHLFGRKQLPDRDHGGST